MVADALRALASAARAHRFRWYVFGAQAVLVHGVPRLTADVDVTIDAGAIPRLELLAALAEVDLVPRAGGLDEFLAVSRLLPLVFSPTHTPVDVVLAGDGIEQDFLARAISVDFGGYEVPVLSPEDLIATKVIALRRKDREDVLGILATQGDRVDLTRLRQTLADVDAALEEPRAVQAFDRILRAHLRRTRARR